MDSLDCYIKGESHKSMLDVTFLKPSEVMLLFFLINILHPSPFTLHPSQFTIHNSQFTIHTSPFLNLNPYPS